jgi:endonuclease YncB( thermonuclease family)
MFAAIVLANVLLASPIAVDGDTVRTTTDTYRVANIDAPETGGRARCASERALGARASERVATLLRTAERVVAVPVGRRDRYDRVVAYIVVDGRDLGEVLMAEGLARAWRGRREPWC